MRSLVGIFALLLALAFVDPAVAKSAHCYCQIATWQSSPVEHPAGVVHNFGEITTYGSQAGHNNACAALCATTSTGYFNNLGAAGQASLCAGRPLYAYSAVGGNAYNGAGELACPVAAAPKFWLMGQSPSGNTSTVLIGVNRTLLPVNRKIKVCISGLSASPTFFQETCYTYANGANVGSGSATSATVTFDGIPRNAHYRVTLKVQTNVFFPPVPLYATTNQIEIQVT